MTTLQDEDAHEPMGPALRPAIDGSDIRKLTEEQVPRIATALARAFEDDPVMGWVFPDAQRLARLERGFTLYLRRIWLRHEQCYATDRLFGAALWLPPGSWHLGPVEQLRLLPSMLAASGRNLPRLLRVLRMMEVSHPAEPEHYYLAVLGVEPELQGRGFGSALMSPVLEHCDRERIAAYLESSKRRNCVLYERHGFRIVEELRLPKGGPPLWRMWREPQS
jgi:ribosomal protein S18 acetylase RimI-like enzyme